MKDAVVLLAVLAALAFSVAAGAGDDEPEKLDLRLRFEKGQTYQITMTREFEASIWHGTAEIERTESTETTRTFEVLSVDDEGAATVKVTTDREAGRNEEPPRVIAEWDSEQPARDVPVWIRAKLALVGHSHTVRMSPQGRVLEVKDVEALRKAAMDALPEDEALQAKFLDALNECVAEETLKERGLSPTTGFYPDKPVAVGDLWTLEEANRPGPGLILETTYTLASRHDGVATIKCEGTIEPDPDAEPIREGVSFKRLELSGTLKGAFRIDEKTGMIVEGQVTIDLDGDLVLWGEAGMEEKMSFPMTSQTIMEFKVE